MTPEELQKENEELWDAVKSYQRIEKADIHQHFVNKAEIQSLRQHLADMTVDRDNWKQQYQKKVGDIGDALLVEKQHHAHTKGMVLELKRALTESQKETLHQKYMRCLDLAKSCDYAGEVARYHDFGSSPEFYAKWKCRWLDIARDIKEYIDEVPVLR